MSNICDDLRAAILQAAMQGKLTRREASDDSAEELSERIIEERSVFKPNKFVEKDSDRASIPDEWHSLKSGEVFELLTGEKISNSEDLPLLDAKYFRGKQFSKTNKGYLANKDDVLMLVDGENSGETFLCTESGYMGSTFKRLFIPKCINRDFALYFLEMNKKVLRNNKRGEAIPHLDKKLFFNFVFPIPPLAEQKRIVEKIDELMACVADLEQSADALASLKKTFPDDIKASLLQAAMQGKLTKQLPEDGNAEDLLEEIKAEKEKLITEGKIKKQKPLAPITDDETPFNIPENWKWVRLPDISESLLGKTLNKSIDNGVEKPYLCSINIYWNGVNLNKVKTAKFSQNDIDQYRLSKNDLLICEGGDVGRSAIWNLDSEMYYQNALHRIRFYGGINVEYIHKLLNCYKRIGLIDDYSKGVTIKHLVQSALNQIPIPLPPLTEQKRIVERLDALMQNINVVGDLIASE